MLPIDVSSKTIVPFELYSLAGEVTGATFGARVTVGAGVNDGLGESAGVGLVEGAENKQFGNITKNTEIRTAATAIIPNKIVNFLFLALVCGLFLPH